MFKEFKKSDLRNSMVVEIARGDKLLVLGDTFSGEGDTLSSEDFWIDLIDYDDDLNNCYEELNIVKVYNIVKSGTLKGIFKQGKLELIWEREKEIDWEKVPEGTKVQVKDHHDREWVNRYFSNFKKGEKMPFSTWLRNKDEFTGEGYLTPAPWKYCRIHPSIKIKEEWYK